MEHINGRTTTKRLGRGVAALLVIALGMVGLATAVSAQTGPSGDCTGDVVTSFGNDFFGTGRPEISLFSVGTSSRTYTLATALPAGEYVLNAVSYDGYPNREVVSAQPDEQWFAEYLAADGTVLATSGTTADITDAVVEDTWVGGIGSVTIAQEATELRVTHAAVGASNPNSVRPVCVGATEVVAPTPEPVIPPSTVTVTFQDEAPDASTIELDCGGQSESATGRLVQLRLADLPGGSSCSIDYPADRVCELSHEPTGTVTEAGAGALVVSIPSGGGVDIIVDIVCVIEVVDPGTPTTTAAPTPTTAAPVSPTTTAAAVVPEVRSATATPQQANPAFTG
jgi:hypothetical protein